MGILNDEMNRIHHEMAKIADKYFGADRLISADALLREAMEDGAYGYVDAKQIANAPTVDAVSVVRCKDCKYRTVDNDVARYNCGLHLVVNLNDNDFCSRGERREDE